MLHGFSWRAGTEIGQQVLQIAFTAILARLLTKADFGVVAMALIYTRFIRSATQIGFNAAIIQDQNITNEHLSALFYYTLGMNLAISAACFFTAPLAGNFFNKPALVPVVQVLAWTIFLSSLGFPQVMMRKDLDFRKLSLLELSSMLIGNIVGVTMAFLGLGVWSLVARLMVQRFTFSANAWVFCCWRPTRPVFKGAGRYFKFGLNMFGSNLVNFFSQNLVAIITGRYIGAEVLGAYSIAYNLAIVPAQKVQTVLTSVMTPAFSKIQDMSERFSSRLKLSVFSLGLVFIPAMFGLSAVSESFVLVVYGEKWRSAGFFLTFLAFVGLTKGMEHLLRSSLLARGFPDKVLKVSAAEALMGLPLYFVGAQYWGIQGLVFTYLGVSILAFLMTVRYSQKVTMAPRLFLKATLRSFIAAAVMYASLIVMDFYFESGMLALAAKTALGVLIYLVVRILIMECGERLAVFELPLLGRMVKYIGSVCPRAFGI